MGGILKKQISMEKNNEKTTNMKTTPLPSVGEVVSHLPMFPDAEILMEDQLIDYDKYKVGEIATLLTQRDNQAYTSLVEGIEGMKHTKRLYRNEQGAIEDVSTNAEIERNDILTDILENVVKPLYGKKQIIWGAGGEVGGGAGGVDAGGAGAGTQAQPMESVVKPLYGKK